LDASSAYLPTTRIAIDLLDTFQPNKMAIREVDMSSKRYTKEFKIEAVRQVVERGHSVAEVASRLGSRRLLRYLND